MTGMDHSLFNHSPIEGINLNDKTISYLSTKMGLFRYSRKLQFRIHKLQQIYRQIWRTQARYVYYRRKGRFGRSCYKPKAHWSKLGVPRVVTFHWLSCHSPSLAGLLPGEEENLSFSCWSSTIVSILKICK